MLKNGDNRHCRLGLERRSMDPAYGGGAVIQNLGGLSNARSVIII